MTPPVEKCRKNKIARLKRGNWQKSAQSTHFVPQE
jgi:hypothetical protein